MPISTFKERMIVMIKEFLRVVILAAIGAAITAALDWAKLVQDPQIQFILVGLFTSIGKAWDRKIHEDPTTPKTGLLPF